MIDDSFIYVEAVWIHRGWRCMIGAYISLGLFNAQVFQK